MDKTQHFQVTGVDRESGQDVQHSFEAASAANAKVKAELQGIVVTGVTPRPTADAPASKQPPPDDDDAAWRKFQEELHVIDVTQAASSPDAGRVAGSATLQSKDEKTPWWKYKPTDPKQQSRIVGILIVALAIGVGRACANHGEQQSSPPLQSSSLSTPPPGFVLEQAPLPQIKDNDQRWMPSNRPGGSHVGQQ